MRLLPYALLAATLVSACVDDAAEPTEPNQLRGDDKADGGGPLWAGLTSVTIERYTPDPCDNGQHGLGDDAVIYDDWARQRAGIRNLCFEVWSPGITDWDNPDYWRQLDVQVHYRFGHSGAFQQAYVPSIDRRGNNRRYAWSLDYGLDPVVMTPSLAAMKVPFQLGAEANGWASITADLELYFTVNGRTLNSPSDRPFVVRYEGQLREPALASNTAGYVLYDLVTCDQARVGSGAGFFAADLRDPSAIAALAPANSSLIYGAGVARTGASGAQLSIVFPSEHQVAGQTLPGFADPGGLRIIPTGSSMRVELDVYDRATATTRQLTTTLTGCTAAATH